MEGARTHTHTHTYIQTDRDTHAHTPARVRPHSRSAESSSETNCIWLPRETCRECACAGMKLMAAIISPGSVGGVPIMCQTVKVNMASATAQLFSDTPCKTSTTPQQDPILRDKSPVPLLVFGSGQFITGNLAVWLLMMQRGAASHESSSNGITVA